MSLLLACSAQHLNISRCLVQTRHLEDFCFQDRSNSHAVNSEMYHHIGTFPEPTPISFQHQDLMFSSSLEFIFCPAFWGCRQCLTCKGSHHDNMYGAGSCHKPTSHRVLQRNKLVGGLYDAHAQGELGEERNKQQG